VEQADLIDLSELDDLSAWTLPTPSRLKRALHNAISVLRI
jgi:hypothetical protein